MDEIAGVTQREDTGSSASTQTATATADAKAIAAVVTNSSSEPSPHAPTIVKEATNTVEHARPPNSDSSVKNSRPPTNNHAHVALPHTRTPSMSDAHSRNNRTLLTTESSAVRSSNDAGSDPARKVTKPDAAPVFVPMPQVIPIPHALGAPLPHPDKPTAAASIGTLDSRVLVQVPDVVEAVVTAGPKVDTAPIHVEGEALPAADPLRPAAVEHHYPVMTEQQGAEHLKEHREHSRHDKIQVEKAKFTTGDSSIPLVGAMVNAHQPQPQSPEKCHEEYQSKHVVTFSSPQEASRARSVA